ncbi:YARHG domain-containing protein [Sulfitobacter sp.]|nr:YARHG domain-containing protein [Sulfitobacter sp.]
MIALTALWLSPTAAIACECQELWLFRNAIFKNKGYCFGSAGEQGVLGNAGCTTKNPSLSSSDKTQIANIKAREKRLGCVAQKSRWSVAQMNAVVARLQGQNTQQARPVQPQRNCSKRLDVFFNVANYLESERDTQLTGSSRVSAYASDSYGSVQASGNNCIGGRYNFLGSAEYNEFNRKLGTWRGSFTVSDYATKCSIEVSDGGCFQAFCQ